VTNDNLQQIAEYSREQYHEQEERGLLKETFIKQFIQQEKSVSKHGAAFFKHFEAEA